MWDFRRLKPALILASTWLGLQAAAAIPAPAPSLPKPDIRVSMSVSPAEAKVGEQVSFTVKVSNTGTADSAAVNVLDKFPPQLSDIQWACAATGSTACATASGSGTIQMENVAMAVGSELTFTARALLRQLPPSGTVSNQVAAQDNTGGEDADASDNFAQATVRVAGLVTTMAAAQAAVGLGERIQYTVEVRNPGAAAYAGAGVSVDLSDVLAEARLNNDFKASDGSAVSFTAPNLTWNGAVPAGGTVQLTYSATVNDAPAEGTDNRLAASAVSLGCLELPLCATSVALRTAKITRSTSSTTSRPGETIAHTVQVTNTGPVDFPAASFKEDLSTVLDSATYNGDVKTTQGTIDYAEPHLAWSADLAPGATATVTYSVTVTDAREGDAMLTSAIVPGSPMVCEGCGSEVRIARLRQEISASPSGETALKPGDVVDYKVTLHNDGTAAFTGASYVNDLAEVLDDAVLNGDPTATAGQIALGSPKITWSGDVQPGSTVELKYSVTVQSGGDGVLRSVVLSNDTNCKQGLQTCLAQVGVTTQEAEPTEPPGDPSVEADVPAAQTITDPDQPTETPVTGTQVWKLISIGLATILFGLILLMIIGRITSRAPQG